MTSYIVLILSGALGFYITSVGFPDWQVAVETAQVIAGIVRYPPDNPFYIYHLKLWTVVHHVSAVLLLAGLSEIQISVFLVGIQGMVTFQALAMFVYALSRDAVLALIAPLVVIASGTAAFGVAYPIFLLGTSHTYGALGLSTVVLAAALIGCGHNRLGLFLAGLAPSVHPSLGLWLVLVVAITLAFDVADAKRRLRTAWPALVAGLAITSTSLAIQLYMARHIAAVPSEVVARYLAAFTALWDEHRRPVWFDQMGVRLNVAAFAVCAFWLVLRARMAPRASASPRDGFDDDAVFLLRFSASAAVVGIGFMFLSWVPPSRLPPAFVMLMPTRLLNVNAMTFTAMVLGIAGGYGRWTWGRWTTVVVAALLLIGPHSMVWEWLAARGFAVEIPRVPFGAVLAAASVLVAIGAALTAGRGDAAGALASRPRMMGVQLARLGLAGALLWLASGPVVAAGRELTVLRDRTNDIVFSEAARARGMLLTGGDLSLIQLRSRRPVMINGGAIDTMAYAHESAPALDRILREVYELDLFNPPPGTPKMAVVPSEYNRRVWQSFTPERWQRIGRTYGISQVMVPFDWELQLPIVARSGGRLLYDLR